VSVANGIERHEEKLCQEDANSVMLWRDEGGPLEAARRGSFKLP